jgi:hypothetical protein
MTARSPFAPYANARLRFVVSSGALVADALGNVAPSSNARDRSGLHCYSKSATPTAIDLLE